MSSEDDKNFESFFECSVPAPMAEWDVTSETLSPKGALVREFQHRATKDTVSVSQSKYYDACDEMDVVRMDGAGTYKGEKVAGTLLIKPFLD